MKKILLLSKDNNNPFRKKLDGLWKDKRTYKERLLLAALPSFALCFTFIFFGPIELTAFNQASLSFDVFNVTWMLAAVSLVAFSTMTLVLALLRGKVFNKIVTAIFALLLCGYLQGNVLNGSLGALTGDTIKWEDQKFAMILSLAVWLAVFQIPYLVLYFDKKLWRNVVLYGSALLVAMQVVALAGIYAKTDRRESCYLSTAGMFDYSPKANTLVFLVDMLDYHYIDEILEEDPSFFDRLTGFTAFTNAVSEFPRTMPAANFMLTGYMQSAWKVPAVDYLDNSWNARGGQLLHDLKNAGYRTELYSGMNYFFRSTETAKTNISNCSNEKLPLDALPLTKCMLYLSAYRYAPVALKPFFWCYTDDVDQAAFQNGDMYQLDDTQLDRGLGDFQVTGEGGVFKLYHLNGSHAPYVLKADGTESDTPTSGAEQTKGCFEILFRVLNKIKELGIYENASIIISADHGEGLICKEPLQNADRIGMFYKPAGRSDEPLAHSKAPVSLANIPATIIKSTGMAYSGYGKALDDVKEEDQVTRVCHSINLRNGREITADIFEVVGDASDFANWTKVEEREIQYSFYD